MSSANTIGARVRTEPEKMNQPLLVSRDDESITVSWTAQTGTVTGNSDIIEYILYYDSGTNGGSYTIAYQGLNIQHTVSGLNPKTQYKFKT